MTHELPNFETLFQNVTYQMNRNGGHTGNHILVGQHHSLGHAGGAASVADDGQIVNRRFLYAFA